MALSAIEGCTLGGLDEGRGHNTRILGFRGSLTALDVSATSVHTVDEDGTVVNSNSAGSAVLTADGDSKLTGYGHGVTLQVPPVGDGVLGLLANVFKITFGVVGTHASGVLVAVADPEVLATSGANSSIGGAANAVAAADLPFTIQSAQVNVTMVDTSTDPDVQMALMASVSEIVGNTISIRITQPMGVDGTDTPIVDADSLILDVMAFATAN